jgi:predicted DNA-binding transcriptional regulator YafY
MDSTGTVGRQNAQAPDIGAAIRIEYINYRGERSLRLIVPQHCYFAEVDWHPGTQWILDAWDVDKGAVRSFAMRDIQRWDV